jgi:hypothetical protein
MKIALGGFARSSIEAQLGSDLAAGVELALRQYARRLRSSQRPPRFPSFSCEPSADVVDTELDLAVDPEVQRILEQELRESERSPSPEQLAVHAVFAYLAELDRSPA